MSGGDKYMLIRVIGQYVVNGLDLSCACERAPVERGDSR